MALSEMQALAALTDYRLRKFLKEQVALRERVEQELSSEDISVDREMQLKDALEIISDNIAKIRMEGIL